MKCHVLLLSLGFLISFLVFSNAERYRRTLDRPGLNKTDEGVTLPKQDVLDLITTTPDPNKSITNRASNHVTESFTESTHKPSVTTRESEQTGEQLQKIPEDIPPDSHVEISYQRKTTLREDNPQAESQNIKNETMFKDYNNFIKYKYNQSSPSTLVNSEVTITHSSYEQSSSVIFDEEDDDYTPQYEQTTKNIAKNERKKKKKDSVETVTVPMQQSTTKPLKEHLHKVDKVKTDALDEGQSTSRNSSLVYNRFEPDNNSLDFSVTTVSSKDNMISQSGNIVINKIVNSDPHSENSTKKPRMTYYVKKSAVINDTSVADPDAAHNTVPVVKWEKVYTTLKPISDQPATNISPKISIVKPNIEFKSKLGIISAVRNKNVTVIESSSKEENDTMSKSTLKPITSFMERKRPTKLMQENITDFTVPPTSTAWVSLATLKSVSTSRSNQKSSTDKTTMSPFKVKEFVPWSTRLQRSSTTQLSAFNASNDDVTLSPRSSTMLDSETSSSWNNLKISSVGVTSMETSNGNQWTTAELARNTTEVEVTENSTGITTETVTSDNPSLVSEIPSTIVETTGIFTTLSSMTSTNSSENISLPLDMNKMSNDLKVNETVLEPKLQNKIELKKNKTLVLPKGDIFNNGGSIEDKVHDSMDDLEDELKTTHFDLPIEATTSALNPESEEEFPEFHHNDDGELLIHENPFDFKNPAKVNISMDTMNATDVKEVVTGKPHEGDWYNVSVEVKVTTPRDVLNTTTLHTTTETPVTHTLTEITAPVTTTSKPPHCSWEDNPLPLNAVDGYIRLTLETTWAELCSKKEELRSAIVNMYNRKFEPCQVLFMNTKCCSAFSSGQCSQIFSSTGVIQVDLYFVDTQGHFDQILVEQFKKDKHQLQSPFKVISVESVTNRFSRVPEDNSLVVLTISAVSLLSLVVLLTGLVFVLLRKRRKKFNYGQRCTPVSLDDYSLDNISVYNSVRRKGAFRASKRSYGNPAFDDPNAPTHPINFAGLANLCNNRIALDEEFSQIPVITLKPDELPPGAETKNRYANVIPLPETRVQLSAKDCADTLDEYINANYVKGPKGTDKFFIACQAPLQSTVTDFWQMIWQEQCRVVLMLTALQENGVDKCADYLPPSQVIDCHCLFGDFQVTLKKHEVREKYLVSSLQIKNLETNSWREVIHLWYASWPATGVPDECSSMISFLLEAHSYMRNNTGPIVVHCSPGTGRTGTVIAIDLCIREFETFRTVDIPKTVYALRRDRAGAVQTKDQYAFIYQVLNLYATKLTGGALDSM